MPTQKGFAKGHLGLGVLCAGATAVSIYLAGRGGDLAAFNGGVAVVNAGLAGFNFWRAHVLYGGLKQ